MDTSDLIAIESQKERAFNTTCCYCGVGCGVTATIKENKVTDVKGDVKHPANYGRLCVKGSALHNTQESRDRLLHPLIHGKQTSWENALKFNAKKFKKITEKYGADAVAFYLSGQLLTEDYYVANKLMKGFVGTANIDTNSRLCMASAVVAHKRAFGGDLVPGCYEDLEETDLLILVGSNLAYAHPVIYQRIVKAKTKRPHTKIVVLDPRRTATCDAADIHLAIRPGSDAFFFNGLLSYLAEKNDIDQEYINNYCDNFEEALSAAQNQIPCIEQAAVMCDVALTDLKAVFDLFRTTKKSVTVFSQGINQSSSGVDKGNSIINCHLATGKIGKPGSTPFSITGQPNAMGGREVGGLANQLAAHMNFNNKEDLSRVARFWQAPKMAKEEGLKAVDMFRAIHEGKIKAVWIMATNPAVTMPDADYVREALKKCELVIVSECIANTDTANLADVVLPATTWSEKFGTVTNSERCISFQKNLLPPPAEAKHDWQIICDFAKHLGIKNGFNYSHPVEIFREHAALSGFENNKTRGFDISKLSNIPTNEYETLTPVQWPLNADNPNGKKRLFEDGKYFTQNGRAKFIPIQANFPKKSPKNHQVIMNTGRIRDQWHTMSRTGNSAKLLGHTDEPFIDIHPVDANVFNLVEGDIAVLKNRGARFIGRVKIHDGQRRGEVFVPMHWNYRFASSSRADALVNAITDPLCGQPEFKHSPVSIFPYSPSWHGIIYSTEEFQVQADYWVKIPLETGFKYRIADKATPNNWDIWLKTQFPEINDWVEMRDSEQELYRLSGFKEGALTVSFAMQTKKRPSESRWLETQLGKQCDVNTRFNILAGSTEEKQVNEGAIVCSCFQVGENTIINEIKKGCKTTQDLTNKLQCGGNCGSCLPELNSLISEYIPITDDF